MQLYIQRFHRALERCNASMRFFLAMLTCACTLYTTSVASAELETALKTVVVHADREPALTAFDIDSGDYSGFTKTLSREQFGDQLSSLPELLHTIPGLQMRQSGGLGSYSDISLRGTNSKQVNVFLDGMLLNSAQSGQASLQNIPVSILERINVYPDVTPLQLGAAGIGGAIDLQTRKSGEDGTFASLGYGSFATSKADVALFRHPGKWNVLLTAGTLAAENDFKFTNRQGFDNDSHAVTQHRYNNGFEQYNTLFKAGTQITAQHGIETMLQYVDSRKHVPTISNLEEANGYVDNHDLYSQFSYHYQAGHYGSSHRLYFNEQTNAFADKSGTVGLRRPTETFNREDSAGLLNAAYWYVGRHHLVTSLDASESSFNQHDELLHFRRIQAERNTLHVALEDNWQLIDSYLLINANVRRSRYEDDSDSAAAVETGVGAIADASSTTTANNWHVGTKSQMTHWLTLSANTSRTLRAPAFGERYVSGVNFNGNPELKPETSRSSDIGFSIDFANVQATVARFAKEIDDGIIVIYDARGIGKPENTDAAHVDGVEFDLRYQFVESTSVFFRGTDLDSENKSDIQSEHGKKLPGIYHQSYQYGATWQRSQFSIELSRICDRELYYNRVNNAQADDRKTIDASVTWQPTANFNLNLVASNLTDEEYAAYHRLSAPGRAAYLTANIHW